MAYKVARIWNMVWEAAVWCCRERTWVGPDERAVLWAPKPHTGIEASLWHKRRRRHHYKSRLVFYQCVILYSALFMEIKFISFLYLLCQSLPHFFLCDCFQMNIHNDLILSLWNSLAWLQEHWYVCMCVFYRRKKCWMPCVEDVPLSDLVLVALSQTFQFYEVIYHSLSCFCG